ncbi:RsmE family RNA methyltransferase [Spiroplasma endosymbiont of Labia minor]|uniref:16S rRNA (uracil(1498)-N(3))-methyltransferase n=1 Tax=Spiroplasma endosymbiont of Labia minor TaxID=3066305 RepID=UPI0030D19835
MHRYFALKIDETTFDLRGENYYHFKNVVRIKNNERIEIIFDNLGYIGNVKSDNNGIITLENISIHKSKQIKTIAIVGLIKEQKWDFILQKLTELGVTDIIPVQFKRSIVEIKHDKIENKIARWTSICEDASEQSHQTFIPKIHNIVKDINLLKNYLQEQNFLAYELESNQAIFNPKKNMTSSFIIGPEGGFDKFEIEKLIDIGFISVKLDEKIFRTETAAIYMMSIINFVNNL